MIITVIVNDKITCKKNQSVWFFFCVILAAINS